MNLLCFLSIPRVATLTDGFKFDNIMHIGGAFHCEHTCQDNTYKVFLKNGTHSAVLVNTNPIAK
jgi:hypothetical protein